MKSYKDPSFQDRVGRAAEAKQKALEQLRAKPPVDEAVLAERTAARQAKEAADAEKRAARKAADQQAKADKAAEVARQKEADTAIKPTEAELKAARDARYAARKSRK
jgi:hypothetical protein